MAHMLGVRRESVTEAAFALQKLGLIHHARGHITVLDREGLERRACECYAAVHKEYDRLLAGRLVTKAAVRRLNSQVAASTGLCSLAH